MTEIKIRFDLTFSRRFMTTLSAVAIMLCAVPELDSESVTLSTYYPAPSGVYTQMITTGNTYLARDGGFVGFGTAAPVYKIDVVGDIHATGWLRTDGAQGWYSQTYGGGWYMSDGSWLRTYNAKNVWTGGGLLGSDGGLTIGYGGAAPPASGAIISGAVGVGMTPIRKLDVTGDIGTTGVLRAGISSVASGCSIVAYSYASKFGGTQALCAGQYVTTIDSLYTHRYNMPPSDSANGSVICCPCPTGGCTL